MTVTSRFSTCAVLAVLAFMSMPAAAQKPPAAAPVEPVSSSALPDRVTRPMRAVDPLTLRAEGFTIRLWGVKPVQSFETPLELKALDLMDGLIQEQQVTCKITGGTMPELTGRCATQGAQDLALELLNKGFVVVDRRQTYDTVFASAYEKAQEQARLAGSGVWTWAAQKEQDKTPGWTKWMGGAFLPVAVVGAPLAGLLLIGLTLWYWMSNIATRQRRAEDDAERKENILQARERQVLLSTLEAELTENKNKIEAFLVIYGDMLRDLRNGESVPKYQQVGESVQKHPNYSKNVFEANVGKLSLIDIKLAGQLSKLYTALPKEREYIMLDPDVPLDTAIKLLEKIMGDAEAFLAPVAALVDSLQTAQK